MDNTQRNTNSAMITIVGIIAVAALIIAWAAFNRSGEDLIPTVAQEVEEVGDEIEETAEEAADEAELLAARAEARAELLALEARLEVEENYEEAAAEVEEIQDDLDRAYENASAEARQEYRELEAELSDLEQGLRDGTGDVLELFAGIALLLEDDVRVDSDTDGEINGSVD